jgi:peptide/nickel transport system permease protein
VPESSDPSSADRPGSPSSATEFSSGFGGGGSSVAVSDDNLFQPALTEEPVAPVSRRSLVSQLDIGFWVAVAICVIWILLAIFASVLPLKKPNVPDFNDLTGAINGSHWLGADSLGRDTLSRVIFGSRISLVVGFVSITASLLVGGAFGIICGYFKGWIDRVFTIITNVFLSFPLLVLALVLVTYLGHTEWTVVLVLALVAWPLLFRVVRASTIEYSQKEYVLAAQALGSKPLRIVRTLILPDIVPSAITYGMLGVPLAIIAEGALSFLGFSVPTSTPTWGNMIQEGYVSLPNYVPLLIFPSIAMFSFTLPINYVGDKLRQVFDVRQGVI